ncbi:hypothetical protein ACFX2C_006674 [Malus domestica]
MSSSGFKWSFLKLPFRGKKSFHQIAIPNTLGQIPRCLQHSWSGGIFMRTCPSACRPDKSGFTITYGDDSAWGSSIRLILAAQPDHLIGFYL